MVGGLGTLLDIGLYGLLHRAGLSHWPALTLSFGTGVAIGFWLTRRWVFQNDSPAWKGQLLRFLLVIGLMYVLNGLLIEGLYRIFPPMAWRGLFARGTAAASTFPLSYLLHRRFSFGNFGFL